MLERAGHNETFNLGQPKNEGKKQVDLTIQRRCASASNSKAQDGVIYAQQQQFCSILLWSRSGYPAVVCSSSCFRRGFSPCTWPEMVSEALCWDNTGSIAFIAVTAILSPGCSRFELYHGQWNMATSHGVRERSQAFKSFSSSKQRKQQSRRDEEGAEVEVGAVAALRGEGKEGGRYCSAIKP